MASIVDSRYKTYEAGEDLSSSQYLFMTLGSDGQLDIADAITDRAIGVLQNAPDTAGEEALVIKSGETKVVAAEALSVNDVVAPSTAGKAQVALNTQIPCGIVVVAAEAADDNAVIEFFHSGDELGGSDTFTNITFAEGGKIIAGTSTGLEIGDTASQKLGFFGATPVVQPTHNADPAAMASITATNPTAPTAYSAHSAGAVTVTSNAATDLDTTAAALATLRGEVAAYELIISALVVDVTAAKTAIDANNAAIDALNADFATLGLTASS